MACGEKRNRAAYWNSVLRRQRRSGLSVSAFCRKHAVTEASFYYWRAKVKVENQRVDEGPTVDRRFVSLELPPAAPSVEVVLTDGRRVVVPPRFDADHLQTVLAVLGKASC